MLGLGSGPASKMDDYATQVYSATHSLTGRGGRPQGSPRRLLSNRWDSAIMSRVHDVRLSRANGSGGDALSALQGGLPPMSMSRTPLAAIGIDEPRMGSHDVGTATGGGSLSARAVLVSTESASPRTELQAAISRQMLVDTVEGYERAPRWRLE